MPVDEKRSEEPAPEKKMQLPRPNPSTWLLAGVELLL